VIGSAACIEFAGAAAEVCILSGPLAGLVCAFGAYAACKIAPAVGCAYLCDHGVCHPEPCNSSTCLAPAVCSGVACVGTCPPGTILLNGSCGITVSCEAELDAYCNEQTGTSCGAYVTLCTYGIPCWGCSYGSTCQTGGGSSTLPTGCTVIN
jgi:hypothetical protein